MRTEEDALTEAAQSRGELSAEETGRDEGDEEVLEATPSHGSRCRSHAGFERMFVGLHQMNMTKLVLFKQGCCFEITIFYICLYSCDCKIIPFIFASVQLNCTCHSPFTSITGLPTYCTFL